MGYIFDFQDARAYEQWAALEYNQYASDLEHQLMLDLLHPSPGETVLDIGCGAGFSSQPLLEMGLNVTGLDPSPYMLDYSFKMLSHRVDLYRGHAEDLPFGDNSFNYAVFFISLEFVESPLRAIEEACRVAKDKVFFGLLNRFALKSAQRWRKGCCGPNVFEHANFFNLWKLKKMVRSVVGDVPVTWRTVCQFPQNTTRVAKHFERSHIVQRCPFGAFAGMAVTLVPRFRTRPLAIRYTPKKAPQVIPGSVRVGSAALGRCNINRRSKHSDVDASVSGAGNARLSL